MKSYSMIIDSDLLSLRNNGSFNYLWSNYLQAACICIFIFYILHCKYESIQWIIFSKRCHILGSYFKQMVEICNLKWLHKINDLNIKDNVFIWWLYDSFNLWNLAFKAVSQKSNHTFISTHLPVKQLESVFFIRCFYEISSHITQQNERKLNKLHQMVDN